MATGTSLGMRSGTLVLCDRHTIRAACARSPALKRGRAESTLRPRAAGPRQLGTVEGDRPETGWLIPKDRLERGQIRLKLAARGAPEAPHTF